MLQDSIPRRALSISGGGILGVIGLTVWSALFLPMLPASSLSDGSINILIATSVFAFLLCFIIAPGIMRCVDDRRVAYRLSLLIWWFLLVDEVYFTRRNVSYNMGQGTFPVLAYGEGAMWMLSFIVLVLVSFRHRSYLSGLFTGSVKWLSVFILICLFSITYAPGKLYAMAWGFKLVLVVLILQLCMEQMRDVADIATFMVVGFASSLGAAPGAAQPALTQWFQRTLARPCIAREFEALTTAAAAV